MDCVTLEVIAKAKVPQHLEERMVVSGTADVFDVAGTKAFLGGRGFGEFEFHFT